MLEGVKRKYAFLLIVLIAPSLLFGVDYLMNSVGPSNGTKHLVLSAGDQGWGVNITVSHSPFFVSGQQVPVNVTLGVGVSSRNVTLSLNSITVEYRDPLSVDPTSGVVGQWRTLSSAQSNVGHNYTGYGRLTKFLSLTASSPPSSSIFDPLVPTQRVAVNAVADLTVTQRSGSTLSTAEVTLSPLDGQTIYQSQLSTVMSSVSWVFYQFLTSLVILVAYIRIKPARVAGYRHDPYTAKLESYRVERSLAELETLFRSGKIGEKRYAELKSGYEEELAKGRKDQVTGGP